MIKDGKANGKFCSGGNQQALRSNRFHDPNTGTGPSGKFQESESSATNGEGSSGNTVRNGTNRYHRKGVNQHVRTHGLAGALHLLCVIL